jgi:hypothetical protein
MKRLKLLLLYALAAFVFIILFLPKAALYYKAETLLEPLKVSITDETVKDRGFGLVVKNGMLYYEDLHVADLSRVTVTPWIVFNRISVAPFTFSSEMQSFVPQDVSSLALQYSLLDPLHILIDGSGDFGVLSGRIGLADSTITINLTPSAALNATQPFWLKQLRRMEGGTYRYETTY